MKFIKNFSPIGWDKSYPLRPMGDPGLPPTEITRTPSIGSGLYKRNSTAGLSNLSGNTGNSETNDGNTLAKERTFHQSDKLRNREIFAENIVPLGHVSLELSKL